MVKLTISLTNLLEKLNSENFSNLIKTLITIPNSNAEVERASNSVKKEKPLLMINLHKHRICIKNRLFIKHEKRIFDDINVDVEIETGEVT